MVPDDTWTEFKPVRLPEAQGFCFWTSERRQPCFAAVEQEEREREQRSERVFQKLEC